MKNDGFTGIHECMVYSGYFMNVVDIHREDQYQPDAIVYNQKIRVVAGKDILKMCPELNEVCGKESKVKNNNIAS
jgi:hypothetical protein